MKHSDSDLLSRTPFFGTEVGYASLKEYAESVLSAFQYPRYRGSDPTRAFFDALMDDGFSMSEAFYIANQTPKGVK